VGTSIQEERRGGERRRGRDQEIMQKEETGIYWVDCLRGKKVGEEARREE
jgi:hypothetical protein